MSRGGRYGEVCQGLRAGASWTVYRSPGHRSASHSKKFTSSSSSALCCSVPMISQGLPASWAVTVNEYQGTNVCSHSMDWGAA